MLRHGIGILALWVLGSLAQAQPLPATVEFNRDIRPLLSDTCYQCHGPDKAKRKASLRLDTEEGAKAKRDDYHILVPGKAAESELLRRITAEGKKRMPPASAGRQLSPRDIDLLRHWIEQGAKWEKHWAFIPVKRPALPEVKQKDWPRNGIDHFILARLEKEGLSPAPEADRVTLIRRVTLDLTGLPPTPAEIDAFLADQSSNAYEKLVDRLLASPRYGEKMAFRWLDYARYADTNGYQSDGERTMWRWRDWVIDAFNNNMPFDRFTVEQIAGDLLPNPTLEQRIATGFNRNHRGNAEGGIIPEEYAVEYVVDRVDTTATVWLGLTLLCSRCHDHKYDPIAQKEFYGLYAYFNNVPEHGRAVKYGNSPPYIQAPTREQQEQLKKLEAELALAEERWQKLQPDLDASQAKWEKSLQEPLDWMLTRALAAHFALDGETKRSTFRDGSASFVPGKIGWAADFDGNRFVDAGDVAGFGFYDKFTLAAWINPKGDGTILSRMSETDREDGYHLRIEKGKLQINFVKRWLDDALRLESARPIPLNRWQHILVTYDGSRVATGVKLYIDGQEAKLAVLLDELNQSFESKEPFRIGAGGGPEHRFRGSIDDVRIYNDVLTADEAAIVANTDAIRDIARANQRTPAQALKLRACFLDQHAPEAIHQAHQRLAELRRQRAKLVESFPTTMVMEEMAKPRDTFVLIRGEYDKRGDKVGPGVPVVLGQLPAGVPNQRLGFARWLVDPANPLTARVTVNRWWQSYFGVGLVKSVDDFGAQGEWPSHPELLDWLSSEFMASRERPEPPNWNVKHIQRLIVTSAAYRQSSKVSKELWQRDPENRLLARGPRTRLPAEVVRDQALAASGLLVERLGGPSVRPYQPAGLWKDLVETPAGDYTADRGPGLYRRSLYTFWKRTVAPPGMMTFDAAGRETCVVRESRTNTPLQALNLMNDVTFVEAARVLAQRIMTDGGQTPEERLALAFRLATARKPSELERRILVDGWKRHLERFKKDRPAALKLVNIGEAKRNEKLDVAELAAYTTVAGLILNLDETITKE